MNTKLIYYQQQLNGGERAAAVAAQATREPSLFTFVELLESENVIRLRDDPEEAVYYDLLKLFSFGTYKEWENNKALYPILCDEQRKKLQQLTIMSLTMKSGVLEYDLIKREIKEERDDKIEQLMLEMIYYNVLEGFFDQENELFQVEWSYGRDVAVSELGEMKEKMMEWARKCDSIIDRLAHEFEIANNSKIQRRHEQQQSVTDLEKAREEIAAMIKKEVSNQASEGKARSVEMFGSVTPIKETAGSSQEPTKAKKGLLRTLKKR